MCDKSFIASLGSSQVTDFEMVSSMVAVNMEVERRVEQEAALSKVDAAVVPADASAGRDSRMSNVVKLPEMSVQASEDLKAGVIINGYEHVRELGSGSHGKVFLVQVVATGEKLTMKVSASSWLRFGIAIVCKCKIGYVPYLQGEKPHQQLTKLHSVTLPYHSKGKFP